MLSQSPAREPLQQSGRLPPWNRRQCCGSGPRVQPGSGRRGPPATCAPASASHPPAATPASPRRLDIGSKQAARRDPTPIIHLDPPPSPSNSPPPTAPRHATPKHHRHAIRGPTGGGRSGEERQVVKCIISGGDRRLLLARRKRVVPPVANGLPRP